MPKKIDIDINVNSSEAIKGTDNLGESMSGLAEETARAAESSNDLGTGLDAAGKDGAKGLKGVATGFKGVGLAIKAAGIGLVIAAFAALKEILEKQQPLLDFLDTAFTSIGIAVTKVSESLKSSTTEFSALTTVGSNLLTLVLTPIKVTFYAIKAAVVGAQLVWEKSFLGGQDEGKIAELQASLDEVSNDLIEIKDNAVDAAVSMGENFSEAIDEIGVAASNVSKAIEDLDAEAIISAAKRTTALKTAAAIAEAINKGKFEAFDREAELLRQVRDDTTKTFADRIAANEELGRVLNEQEEIMLRNANISIQAAAAELAGNATTENRVALIEAQNEAEAIRADITGRRSEQLINEIGLEQEKQDVIDEAFAKAKEIEDAKLKLLSDSNERAIEINKEHKLKLAEEGLNDPNNTAEELLLRAEELRAVREEIRLTDLEIDQANFEAGLIGEEERNALIVESEKKKTEGLNDLKQKELEAVKIAEEAKKTITQQGLNLAVQGVKTIASIFGKNKKLQAAALVTESAVGIAKMVIANNAANTGALATPQAILSSGASAVPVIAMNNISTGLSIAASIAATTKGLKGLGGGGAPSAPSLGGSAGGGGSSASAPSLSENTLTASSDVEGQETESIGQGAGINQIKAIVVESDITEAQANVSGFQEASEIG